MRIVLVNLPVTPPTIMPYSITRLKADLSSKIDEDIIVLDLNAKYHRKFYSEFYERQDFFSSLEEFSKISRQKYSKISRDAVTGKKPEGQDYLLKLILEKRPDIVGFSLVYNSQIFFAKGIINELRNRGVDVVIGGPADTSKLDCTKLSDASDFIRHLRKSSANEKLSKKNIDFSDYDPSDYLTKEIIYPLRTAYSCPYKACAFCTHHSGEYVPLDLELIRNSIVHNRIKKIFFIDDDFTIGHLQRLGNILKPLNVEWCCQMRPRKQLIPLIPALKKSGMRAVACGVESGSQRILNLMRKGTELDDITEVLKTSHYNGIRNIVYIMFGFPTETKDEFKETIKFLKENQENIDLVSSTLFGLQQGSYVYENPDLFNIGINKEKRTLLGDKITYKTGKGLSHREVYELKKRYSSEMDAINKVPKVISIYKEQILEKVLKDR